MSLFKGVKGDSTNADIGWRIEKAAAYESGYLTAAEILYDVYDGLTILEKDTTIFPIIFLYRQHIELSLKKIIRTLSSKPQCNATTKLLNGHLILNLWDKAIELYVNYFNENKSPFGMPLSDFDKERKLIIEFNTVDNGSFSFRYSTDKNGNELLEDIEYISLKNFRNEILKVVEILIKIQEELAHI